MSLTITKYMSHHSIETTGRKAFFLLYSKQLIQDFIDITTRGRKNKINFIHCRENRSSPHTSHLQRGHLWKSKRKGMFIEAKWDYLVMPNGFKWMPPHSRYSGLKKHRSRLPQLERLPLHRPNFVSRTKYEKETLHSKILPFDDDMSSLFLTLLSTLTARNFTTRRWRVSSHFNDFLNHWSHPDLVRNYPL